MPGRVYGWVIVALLLVSGSLSLPEMAFADESIRVLRVGQFHGEEVTAKTGEAWMGLYRLDDGVLVIKPVTVEVELVNDPIVDLPEQKTGKRVFVQDDAVQDNENETEPLLLLQGPAGLFRPGGIETAFAGDALLVPGQWVDTVLEEGFYRLIAYGDVREDDLVYNYRLKLFGGDPQITQQLDAAPSLSFLDSGVPRLLWAGDLDRDGKLDLLLDLSHHYNETAMTLFLSSQAESGQMVKKVATFLVHGC